MWKVESGAWWDIGEGRQWGGWLLRREDSGREYSGWDNHVWREDSGEGGQWGVVRTEGREDSKSWWDSGEGGWRGMVGLWGGRTMVYGVTVGREDSGTC